MSAPGVVAVLILAVAAALPAQTQAPASPTPGSIPLLLSRPRDEALTVLRQALRSQDPVLRIVAARATAVGPFPELTTPLIGALAAEQDEAVAVEQISDVLRLAGASAMPIVEAQVLRRGGRTMRPYAAWLARSRPKQFVSELPELARRAGFWSVDDAVAMAARQYPESRDEILRTWMPMVAMDQWLDTLSTVLAPPADLASSRNLLQEALQSTNAFVRADTVWFLLGALAGEREVPDRLLEAALPAAPSTVPSWETFGRELIQRRLRHAATPDRTTFLSSQLGHNERAARGAIAYDELTDSERAVLETAFGPAAEVPADDPVVLMRTVPYLAPRLVADTLTASGCVTSNHVGLSEVTFAADGRPKRIQIDPTGLTKRCQQALAALVRLTVAADGEPVTEQPVTLMLPFTSGFVACISEDVFAGTQNLSSTTPFTPGRRTHAPLPSFTRSTLQQRATGTVTMTASVAPSGCVYEAEVRHRVKYLDALALRALVDWRWEPALAGDVPVPFRADVSIFFPPQ